MNLIQKLALFGMGMTVMLWVARETWHVIPYDILNRFYRKLRHNPDKKPDDKG